MTGTDTDQGLEAHITEDQEAEAQGGEEVDPEALITGQRVAAQEGTKEGAMNVAAGHTPDQEQGLQRDAMMKEMDLQEGRIQDPDQSRHTRAILLNPTAAAHRLGHDEV